MDADRQVNIASQSGNITRGTGQFEGVQGYLTYSCEAKSAAFEVATCYVTLLGQKVNKAK